MGFHLRATLAAAFVAAAVATDADAVNAVVLDVMGPAVLSVVSVDQRLPDALAR